MLVTFPPNINLLSGTNFCATTYVTGEKFIQLRFCYDSAVVAWLLK